MNKKILLCILFFSSVIQLAYAVNVVISLPDSEQTVNIDSYYEEGRIYIHLPSLIMKINGAISIQDNLVKLSINNKNVNLDFQNNLASINDITETKLIQLQNPIKIWQDTIWIELNDAKLLIQNITGGKLETKDTIQEKTVEEQPIDNTKENETEINEKYLMEKVSTDQEIVTPKKENIFTLDKIFIDAGHGGEDRGLTLPSGKYEKEITLLFATNLDEQMKKDNINTALSRVSEQFIGMKERCNGMLNEKVDYFISVHTEAPVKEREGLVIFVSKLSNNDLNTKNNYIADEIIKSIKEKYKDMRVEKYSFPLYLSDCTNIPGIILELIPRYKDDLKEEKWDTFLDKKSD
ncbi:MAG: N-acetylmuramoyl-L-alanine amidase family protein, partial [Candidatus Hydrogenedens sp.]